MPVCGRMLYILFGQTAILAWPMRKAAPPRSAPIWTRTRSSHPPRINKPMNTRRAFIKFLATSPLYAGAPYFASGFAHTSQAQAVDGPIARAGDALDVFRFEPVAHGNIPPAHWGYLVRGVDARDTLR